MFRCPAEAGRKREYQAIPAYVVYSLVLDGIQHTSIAGELEEHAKQEWKHTPSPSRSTTSAACRSSPLSMRLSDDAREMRPFDLDDEILVDEQDHQIASASVPGRDVAEVMSGEG